MYPQTVILQNDAEIELWPMTPEDAPALLEFYRSLPQDDLLYLREDVTSSASMQRWIEGVESEQSWHLLAGYEGRIIADGELERQFYGWSQHIGELRIVVDRLFRNSGLSRHMTNEILGQAVDDGLYKVMVQMTVDQRSASRMFERVGFRHEAVLKDHAKDQHGELCDLVIMSYFTRDFLDLSAGRSSPAADDQA